MPPATSTHRTIGIIGSAIAGPTFALQILSHPILRKQYRPILFDRGKDPRLKSSSSNLDQSQTGGASVGLFGNGIYPLYQLGLKDVFDRSSCETPTMSFWSATPTAPGPGPGRMKYLGRSDDAGWDEELKRGLSVIEREKLQVLLVDRVETLGGEVFWDHELTGLERLSGQNFRARFGDVSHDLDLVVGADGAYSRVRKYLLNEINPQTAEERWMPENCGMTGVYSVSSNIDAVKQEMRPDTVDDTNAIWLSPGLISTSPLPDGKMRWDLVLPEPQPFVNNTAGTLNESKQPAASWESKIIANFYPRSHTAAILHNMTTIPDPVVGTFESLLSSSTKIIHTPLRQRVWEANEIQYKNIVLLGDAARVLLPSSGQGTSFAIEEATALANALLNNPPDTDGDFSAALTEYAKERVPRSKKMATMAYWAGRMGLGEMWYWRWLRNVSSRLAAFSGGSGR